MIIGELVTLRVDFGQNLPDTMQMKINSCSVQGTSANAIEFITNGVVHAQLTNMVTILPSQSNRVTDISWKVFQAGRGSTATVSCRMKIEKKTDNDDETTTASYTTAFEEYSGFTTDSSMFTSSQIDDYDYSEGSS